MTSLVASKWEVEYEKARRSFSAFLPYWRFINRETGAVQSFGELWEGQRQLVDVYDLYAWVFALKAGKLGFTELECAFDGWSTLRRQNARVHIFSVNQRSSQSMLRYVKFGLGRLPSEWGVQFAGHAAGGETAQSLIVTTAVTRRHDPEDFRYVVSYPASAVGAIDQTASHTHVDELSHMSDGETVWNAVFSTVAPNASCHVVTRGAGKAAYSATLWAAAEAAPAHERGVHGSLFPFFASADLRPLIPERDRERILELGQMTPIQLGYFLPMTPEDALASGDLDDYIPIERWDRLAEELPLPTPDEPLVISVDGAVTGDSFAVVVVSRHPDAERHADASIRFVRIWRPRDFEERAIDFRVPDHWVRFLCEGGCRAGHPKSKMEWYAKTPANEWPEAKLRMPLSHDAETPCELCVQKLVEVGPHNVVQITFDPYQLIDMAQQWRSENIAWVDEFDQGTERLIGDGLMYKLAIQGRMSHNGDRDLREHVANAKAKVQADEDSRMRIVKRSAEQKVDAAVAAAQGVKRILDLNL